VRRGDNPNTRTCCTLRSITIHLFSKPALLGLALVLFLGRRQADTYQFRKSSIHSIHQQSIDFVGVCQVWAHRGGLMLCKKVPSNWVPVEHLWGMYHPSRMTRNSRWSQRARRMHQPADRRAVRYVYLVVKKICHEKKAKETHQH
jgi:hypothetical protein